MRFSLSGVRAGSAGLSRDSYRHPPEADPMAQDLQARIARIAHVRRRFGYRRIHDLLRPSHPGVNHKRVYRLYTAANLAVRKRKNSWHAPSTTRGAWTSSATA